MPTTYDQAVYRGGQQGFLLFADEITRMLPQDEVAPALPTDWELVGYADVPGIEENENAQIIESAGSYQGVDIVNGRREYIFNSNVKVGSLGFIQRAVRASVIAGYAGSKYRCLPQIAIAGGALKTVCDTSVDENYVWVGRQGFIQDLRFQFSEGQPVTCSMSVMALLIQEILAGAIPGSITGEVDQDHLIASAGSTLMWHHMDWVINGVSYRPILGGVNISINNNIQRVGMRKIAFDGGNLETEVSRIPYGLHPLGERLNVEYQLHDKIPASMRRGNTNWGEVIITAVDTISNKSLTLTIDNNMMSRHAQGATQPNNMLSFSSSTVSKGLSMEVS